MTLPAPLKDLLSKLGVGHVLSPYEAMPWSCYDSETGKTCTAEVRMSGEGDMIEAEAQIMYDEPQEDRPMMEQVCLIKARPTGGEWNIGFLRVRNEPYGQDIYNWQEKSCDFFQSLVEHLIRNEMPDVDDLLDKAFHSNERYGGNRRGGGGKKPKVDTSKLMKKKGF